MYGDTAVIRKRAEQLREQALDIRGLADTLVGQAEATPWHGRAAEAMRTRVRERAAQLRESAAQHETAATSLDRHAREVDIAKEAIAGAQRRARDLVEAATERLARTPDPDPQDVVVAGFEPPPPGHRDWLSLDLPGL